MRKVRKTLLNQIKRCFHNSQEHLLLILQGMTGIGKKTSLIRCFKKLRSSTDFNFHVVWLNGYIHKTDESCLNSIISQLEIQFISLTNSTRNQKISFIERILEEGKIIKNPIFFVLEDFDQFARLNKKRFLYFISNLQQNLKMQICIIGITTCHNVFQFLEKRVKSRFTNFQIKFPSVLDELKIIRLFFYRLLCVQNVLNKIEKRYNISVNRSLNSEVILENLKILSYTGQSTFKKLEEILVHAILELDRCKPIMSVKILHSSIKNQSTLPNPLDQLQDLDSIQLLLIISMCRLRIIKKNKKYTSLLIFLLTTL